MSKTREQLIADERPKLYYKYDECVEVFWINPWDKKEEKLFMMMWPGHPIEATQQVERWFEEYAKQFCQSNQQITDLEQQNKQLVESITKALDKLELFNFGKDHQRVYEADAILRQALTTLQQRHGFLKEGD